MIVFTFCSSVTDRNRARGIQQESSMDWCATTPGPERTLSLNAMSSLDLAVTLGGIWEHVEYDIQCPTQGLKETFSDPHRGVWGKSIK